MEIKLKWEASFNHDTWYEYTNLLISSSSGHDLVYRCVRNDTGSVVTGVDLTDPMVVLPMVLKDLGINVTDK